MTKQEMARYSRRKQRILRLHNQHIPHAEIARRLNMTRQRVNQIVNGK